MSGYVNDDMLKQLLAQQAGGGVVGGQDFLKALNPLTGVSLQNPEAWAQAERLKSQPGADLYTQGAGANLGEDGKRYQDAQGNLFKVTGTDAQGNPLIQFSDNSGGGWQNPTGDGSDRVQPTYSLGKDGTATPVDAGTYHKDSAWVDWGRPVAALAATMATAGAGGAYLAGAEGAAGAGAAGAAGAGTAPVTTAGSVAGLGGLGTGAETSVAAQLGASAGAEMAAGAGAGGGLSSAETALLMGGENYGAGMTAAEVAASAEGAGGAYASGAGGLSSADTAALFGNAGYGSTGGGLSSLFSGLGQVGSLFKTGGQGYGLLQTLSALYGLQQSNKIGEAAKGPGITKAGMDAVQRSWAAQGYQGSGNMAAALERYGAQTNQGNIPGQVAGLQGQLSSLGLLTAGLPALFGWNTTTGGG